MNDNMNNNDNDNNMNNNINDKLENYDRFEPESTLYKLRKW